MTSLFPILQDNMRVFHLKLCGNGGFAIQENDCDSYLIEDKCCEEPYYFITFLAKPQLC